MDEIEELAMRAEKPSQRVELLVVVLAQTPDPPAQLVIETKDALK